MRIFVSYRRSDAQAVTGNLWQQLCGEFGDENIFFDHASLPAGLDYQAWIAAEIAGSAAVLVVIGPGWTTVTQDGIQRLSIPEDDVRREVELALAQVGIVIPVLVGGAAVPRSDELPESIRPLVKRTAVTVRDYPDFIPDSRRLAERLRQAALAAAPAPADVRPVTDPAGRCRELGEAGRIDECLDVARQLLDPAASAAIDQVELAVDWMCYARRWSEATERLEPLVAAATDQVVRLRLELLVARTIGATDSVPVADLERIVAGCRATLGGGSIVTTRARGELAATLAWADAEERAANLLRELADDIPHSFRSDPFNAVWERLWLASGVINNTHPRVREAAAELTAVTLADGIATLGADHPLSLYGRVLDARLSGTDPATQDALRTVVRQYGRSHPGYAWLLGADVLRLKELGELTAAADARARLLAWNEDVLGADHPNTWGTLESLAELQSEAGLADAAVQTAETLLTRRRLSAGRTAEPTLAAAVLLARALRTAGRASDAFDTLARVLAESTAPASGARVDAELALIEYAWAKADYADCLARAERLLADIRPDGPAAWASPWLRRMAVYSLEAMDRIEEALGHSESLLPPPGDISEPQSARDVIYHGLLLYGLDRYAEVAELLTTRWDEIAAALADDPVHRVQGLALREVCLSLANEESTALHELFNELAELSRPDFDEAHASNPWLPVQALILLSFEPGLIPGLTDAGLRELTDRAVSDPATPLAVFWAVDVVGQHPDGLGFLRRLLEHADPVAAAVAERPRLALAYARAHRGYQSAWPALEPLRHAPDPYAVLAQAHDWWRDNPDEVADDVADELYRVHWYAAMDGHPVPAGGPKPFIDLISRLRAEHGSPGQVVVTSARPWEAPLPADPVGRSAVAAAALGCGLVLLRQGSQRVYGTAGRGEAGVRLIAATVLRLDASSHGRHLLGDAGWTAHLPGELPDGVRRRLIGIDRTFAPLAERGAQGWIGEDVPDLFEHARIRDAPWQQVTQALVNRWAEPKFAALPDPYGRYKDGSWPVPPPDGELPQAYLDFADLLLRATHDGFLFGDR